MSSGQWVYRLEPNNTWTPVLQLSTMSGQADAKTIGDVTHILIANTTAKLASIEYVPALNTYQLWSQRPTLTSVYTGETGTIDVDSTGRMWLATETNAQHRGLLQRLPVFGRSAVPSP